MSNVFMEKTIERRVEAVACVCRKEAMMAIDVYEKLAMHLDDLPAGFPRTESGVEIRILRRLFTPDSPGGRRSKLSKFLLGKFTMPIRREGKVI
jgi:hypothetical protein